MDTSGVIFISHLPDGFFEFQLKQYFRQFGRVRKARVSRSAKTGGSRGYAYVQFADDAVAKIAASTMNNYLMFDKILKCEYMPPEKVHAETFNGCGRKFVAGIPQRRAARAHNSQKSAAKVSTLARRLRGRLRKKNDRLAGLGIDYRFPVPPPQRALKSEIKQEEPGSADEAAVDAKAEQEVFDTTAESAYSMHVDSTEDEITFRTPPNTVKKRLVKTKKPAAKEKKKGDSLRKKEKVSKIPTSIKTRYFHS